MFISCFPNKLADNVKKFIAQDKIQGIFLVLVRLPFLPKLFIVGNIAFLPIHGCTRISKKTKKNKKKKKKKNKNKTIVKLNPGIAPP